MTFAEVSFRVDDEWEVITLGRLTDSPSRTSAWQWAVFWNPVRVRRVPLLALAELRRGWQFLGGHLRTFDIWDYIFAYSLKTKTRLALATSVTMAISDAFETQLPDT
jgi:hypothetical protein